MPLTILASVSLLALVVTGRPLLPQDVPNLVQPTGEVQDAVQAILESRIGSGYLKSDNDDEEEFTVEGGVQVRLSTSESQTAYLSQLASEDVKLIIPLGDNPVAPSVEEQALYEALEGLDALDGGTRPLEEVLSNYGDDEEYPTIVAPVEHASPLALTLIACAVSLALVFIVGAGLYVMALCKVDFVSKRLFRQVWHHIEKDVEGATGGLGYKEKPMIVEPKEEFNEKVEIVHAIVQSRSRESLFEDAKSSNGELEDGDEEDDFEDAPEGEPSSSHPDPDLLQLPSSTAPAGSRSPLRRPLQMREIPSNPPSWSVRASESPSLSIGTPPPPSVLAPSLAVEPVVPSARRRAYRDPLPEFDLALALQLRPGFGVGADAAWLVRFMMGIFGWFTVLVAGGRQEESMRLIQGY